MTEEIKTDICVIGAGSAGLTLAAAASAFDVPTVLIETGRMGGDCLNYGCVPSKALIAAARHVAHLREAPAFGIKAGSADVDFAAVHAHIRSVIAAIAPNDSQERFTGLGVRVIRERASFLDRRAVIAGETRISARRFVIATGSSPQVPDIEGLDGLDYLTNESLFDLTKLPTHLIVIGGGPVGMEMAQAFRRLGSEVSVLERGHVLSHDDPELSDHVRRRLVAEGVTIHEETEISRVARRGRYGVRVHIRKADGSEEAVDGTQILIATGRRPNVGRLDLDKAGVDFDETGIKVGADLRTRNRRVYAVGDVTGGPNFTHWAGYEAGLVLRPLLFRIGARPKPDLLPWVTYTDPELAHVGLTLQEAERRHRHVRVLRWPVAENDRARAERQTEGLIRLVTTRRGRLLGVDIVARNAGEMIAPYALALSKRLNVRDMMGMILPYPTVSEVGKRAATSFYAPIPNKAKALARFLRRFG
ncbi:dihydrolipoyl dehydrogenase family protein [Afifella marina]|uniref:Pyruvate/2-oxoglutarate dehydrogenase complex, dihydrolipoamide dehydrogenase (E3) component n=1 Tax=Afifella marina DSM 2698 TaxID=1120955 RepID=A0A1G5N9T1_AFIMA|nr:FAD-dependent oxidoreductase [Afifella marina]MBK1623118.1 dihydrolipoamide dehydrogenase [Afifella marina DSM 2698]MBK1626112.1 dihydrolipoamide dehydrogenase [Afifella marina]MBK5916990.1 dihydrolipoamide dehydrogenase [Afifella marina]RAI21992.1 dihydrolipoamide dehydrogenase [Afifella marina DSM 2698]SCZ34195.1 Pyruvate/2-oxoglutarate dehydrogenase complex, dihydrolipoamide dehydrogenase (E3) component [Afifella marina DSM 2698]